MYPYTGLTLIDLLEKQHQAPSPHAGLFKSGVFNLIWRAKVGSFPHPDLETLVSAGEPCGAWRPQTGRPEDKRNVGENWTGFKQLPLNGYIPASSIRGLVRDWAKKRPEVYPKMVELLGNQTDQEITSGKIEFLDAFPEKPTKLSLDIVNPQEQFQVFHQGQGTPLSSYTLGDGKVEGIPIKIAIRGIPGQTTVDDVKEVWNWVQQALLSYGVGSRTASGYGTLIQPGQSSPTDIGSASKTFSFSLFSQGNAGPDTRTMELRVSHWRGWLRSWVLRFLLGVMSPENAQITLGELFGTLESPDNHSSRKGCVRIRVTPGQTWGTPSNNTPKFYTWKGKIQITAPSETLSNIILPITRFAVMVGGVGRGWRRPLHIFMMERRGTSAVSSARGCYLNLTHQVRDKKTGGLKSQKYGIAIDLAQWNTLYEKWKLAVQNQWPQRFKLQPNNLTAEVFSPQSCAVYLVPGPDNEPLDTTNEEWVEQNAIETRGEGMNLIYDPNYKRRIDVGGTAAQGNAHCSWVSIKRVQTDKGCHEIVCLFMGGQKPGSNNLRARFLNELAHNPSATQLFGVSLP